LVFARQTGERGNGGLYPNQVWKAKTKRAFKPLTGGTRHSNEEVRGPKGEAVKEEEGYSGGTQWHQMPELKTQLQEVGKTKGSETETGRGKRNRWGLMAGVLSGETEPKNPG